MVLGNMQLVKTNVWHRQNVVSKIYDVSVFWKLLEDFQENTLGGVIFVKENLKFY